MGLVTDAVTADRWRIWSIISNNYICLTNSHIG